MFLFIVAGYSKIERFYPYKFNNFITNFRLYRTVLYINNLMRLRFVIPRKNSFRNFCLRNWILNFMAISFYLRTGNGFWNFYIKPAYRMYCIFNHLPLQFKLIIIVNKLKLTSTAYFLHGTKGFNSVRRRFHNFNNFRVCIIFSNFCDFNF